MLHFLCMLEYIHVLTDWYPIFFHTLSFRLRFFFFFQAEDGIRDWSVTGVQTCALPISSVAIFRVGDAEPDRAGRNLSAAGGAIGPLPVQRDPRRSERRRRTEGDRPDHGDAGTEGGSGNFGRRAARLSAARAHGAHCGNTFALCRGPGASHAAQK